MFPIAEAVAEEFGKANPNVRTPTVGISGTGGGFQKFCRGETDISNASRPIRPAEIEACQKAGIEYIEVPIAYDGIAIVVNPKNTWANSITVAELKTMWAPEAQGKITRWNQIRPSWPNREIRLFGAGVDSGTYDYFTEATVGKEGASRGDFTSSEDDNVIVQGVASDELALGFLPLAYVEENRERLKIAPVDDGKGGQRCRSDCAICRNGPRRNLSASLAPALHLRCAESRRPARDPAVRGDVLQPRRPRPRSRLYRADTSDSRARPQALRGPESRHGVRRRRLPGRDDARSAARQRAMISSSRAGRAAADARGEPASVDGHRSATGDRALSGSARTSVAACKRFEFLIEWALFLCALLSIGTTAGIIIVLAVETFAFLREVPITDFLFGTEWTPLFATPRFGVLPLVAGTMLVSTIAMIVALPMGLLSAVYLSEYANLRVRRFVKPVLEVLAGIPTVVYGYFALLFVTPLLQRFLPNLSGFNALGPGIVMGIMILPLVSSLSEDAMQAVPRGLREGSYALGATKMQTSLRVVLPAAFSGITAACILAVSRADRRNDDRGDRGRTAASSDGESDAAHRDDDRLHRAGQSRRHAAGHPRVPDDLRRRHAAVSRNVRAEPVSTWLRERFREEYA